MKHFKHLALGFCLSLTFAVPALLADTASDIKTVALVGAGGVGHPQASAAAERLSKLDSSELIDILSAIEDATPVGKNWLRGIAEDVADNGNLPMDAIVEFIKDTDASRDGRYVGFLLVNDASPDAASALLDTMLDDPSLQIRHKAVAKVLAQAKAAQGDDATALYEKAMASARHPEQLSEIAKALRDAGKSIDLAEHMGLYQRLETNRLLRQRRRCRLRTGV